MNFTPSKPIKCEHCGYDAGMHHARTKGCPVGRKSRIGFTMYSEIMSFTPRPDPANDPKKKAKS